jgi:hypothetical protein
MTLEGGDFVVQRSTQRLSDVMVVTSSQEVGPDAAHFIRITDYLLSQAS